MGGGGAPPAYEDDEGEAANEFSTVVSVASATGVTGPPRIEDGEPDRDDPKVGKAGGGGGGEGVRARRWKRGAGIVERRGGDDVAAAVVVVALECNKLFAFTGGAKGWTVVGSSVGGVGAVVVKFGNADAAPLLKVVDSSASACGEDSDRPLIPPLNPEIPRPLDEVVDVANGDASGNAISPSSTRCIRANPASSKLSSTATVGANQDEDDVDACAYDDGSSSWSDGCGEAGGGPTSSREPGEIYRGTTAVCSAAVVDDVADDKDGDDGCGPKLLR